MLLCIQKVFRTCIWKKNVCQAFKECPKCIIRMFHVCSKNIHCVLKNEDMCGKRVKTDKETKRGKKPQGKQRKARKKQNKSKV